MIRLLVVDNNAEFLEVFTRLLERQPDMEVVAQAASLVQARAKLEEIDVAIIDRGLPDGDGIEIISELREVSPGAGVLVMSTTAEERHPQEALEAGADGVLDKIETPEHMFATIREVGSG